MLSLAVLKKRYLTKVGVASSFLQSRPAQRDVHVVPPREFTDREFYLLLLAAAYGIVNENAKWQIHCDHTFANPGLYSVKYIPQLFPLGDSTGIKLISLKVEDDILTAGSESIATHS